ncbi:MAG: hypothetical protein GF317_15160 [Candidatus Lokiarchaeota archaeon]|nr:hypothetical protein [Candidatus Lokiarchaeota archaeon]MBD3200913.1 hypothetical protein [Candidatus Lokiarchaeota archaeon]
MLNIIIAILQILLGIGFVGFWIFFFLVENKNPENTELYLAFERSFPIPDLGWITPSLFISAAGLLFNEVYGIFFCIISGSALVFLGLLDISFNVQNGGYKKSLSDTLMNLAINLICVIMGPIFLYYGWTLITL